jgi:catalase (peroxidase I)
LDGRPTTTADNAKNTQYIANEMGTYLMPRGPKGEKRPADVIGNAVKIMRIATGEEEDVVTPASAGATLGKLGGQARARKMTPERRAEIAKKAAEKRWRK